MSSPLVDKFRRLLELRGDIADTAMYVPDAGYQEASELEDELEEFLRVHDPDATEDEGSDGTIYMDGSLPGLALADFARLMERTRMDPG